MKLHTLLKGNTQQVGFYSRCPRRRAMLWAKGSKGRDVRRTAAVKSADPVPRTSYGASLRIRRVHILRCYVNAFAYTHIHFYAFCTLMQ